MKTDRGLQSSRASRLQRHSCDLTREPKAYLQHWESGDRMESSSWECRPNLGGETGFRGRCLPAVFSSRLVCLFIYLFLKDLGLLLKDSLG